MKASTDQRQRVAGSPACGVVIDRDELRLKQCGAPTVGKALIETLSLFFGAAFTQEMRAAWTQAYDVVSGTMIAAAERAGTRER